jgi:hypothetical protein
MNLYNNPNACSYLGFRHYDMSIKTGEVHIEA